MEVLLKQKAASFVSQVLEELAVIGADLDGGVTRLLYTPQWLEAQIHVAKCMKAMGLEVRFDRVGNLYGRLSGEREDAPVILTGSHIDTVRSGGNYDGAYGIAAGLAALRYLKEQCGKPKYSLEVVSFCEEEGSRFPLAYWGSGNVTGVYHWQGGSDIRDSSKISLHKAMERVGFGKLDQLDARRNDIGAFVEVHIEQGPTLERLNKQIGIVEAIVGQRRYAVTLRGETNHAGTTPMSMRKDALACAAEIMTRLEADAHQYGEPLVATVGRIEASPNQPNVVPGSVHFTIDIRHHEEQVLEQFSEQTLAFIRESAARRGVELTLIPWLQAEPAHMSSALIDRLERITEEQGMSYRRMVSGAGHDAQLFPSLCPTVMLFVPSRDGISHSPEEYTTPDQLMDGVSVLAALLHELAYEGDEHDAITL